MVDVMKKVYYGDMGSGCFAEVTVESIRNGAILLGNESSGRRFVVFQDEVSSLIKALQELDEEL